MNDKKVNPSHYFRATPDSLLLERKNNTLTTTPCGCRLNLVSEWDLPEKHEEKLR